MRRGGKGKNCNVRDSRSTSLEVVFNLMLLLVKFPFAEEVVDGFVVLENMIVIGNRNGKNERSGLRSRASGPPSYTPSPWP